MSTGLDAQLDTSLVDVVDVEKVSLGSALVKMVNKLVMGGDIGRHVE